MGRKFIDCREYPSEMNCTVAFSADSDEELLEVAVQHAVQVHHHKDSPELRQQIRNLMKSAFRCFVTFSSTCIASRKTFS